MLKEVFLIYITIDVLRISRYQPDSPTLPGGSTFSTNFIKEIQFFEFGYIFNGIARTFLHESRFTTIELTPKIARVIESGEDTRFFESTGCRGRLTRNEEQQIRDARIFLTATG